MDIFNSILSWVGDKINWVLSAIAAFLPDSPFQAIDNSIIRPYLGYINYFIPIDFIIGVLSLWLSAILIYYGYQILMRFAQVIE